MSQAHLSTVLWLRRLSFATNLDLSDGIRKDAVVLKVNTALEAGAFLQENFHLPVSSSTDIHATNSQQKRSKGS